MKYTRIMTSVYSNVPSSRQFDVHPSSTEVLSVGSELHHQ